MNHRIKADWEKDFPAPAAPVEMPATAPRIRFANPERHQVELPLEHPLEADGERLDRLIVRRLTAGEMVRIVDAISEGASDVVLIRHVTAAMAGVSIDVLEALSSDDAGRVAAAALPFMPAGLVAAIERASEPSAAPDDAA
jgi:hypothetical protein